MPDDKETGAYTAQQAGRKGIREHKQEVYIVAGWPETAPQLKFSFLVLPADRGDLHTHDASVTLTSQV